MLMLVLVLGRICLAHPPSSHSSKAAATVFSRVAAPSIVRFPWMHVGKSLGGVVKHVVDHGSCTAYACGHDDDSM